jgi:MinD-like ATPase involved in chromosome partitioning or flagellar assembly
MSVITIGSVTGSPGVTRLAIGLAASWPELDRTRVLLEADADGGRLGAELGIGVEPGLMAVAVAARTSGLTAADVLERGAAPVGDWFAVPAPPSAEQAHSVLTHSASTVADIVASDPAGAVWVVDAGRLSARSPALAFAVAADHVLIVTAGAFPALQLVPHRVDALRSAGCAVSVAVVEPTSWPPDEIADFVGTDVAAVVPRVKARSAELAAMRGNEWRTWWRHVAALASYLAVAAPAGIDLTDGARRA